MVFSSIPAYLDPSNWQQQQQNHQIIGSGSNNTNPNLLPPPPPPPVAPQPVPLSHGSIRPGSMSERARNANIPMPETALKCPRCESANTKFCYFNNYSLSQPRHFCKTCRRYWTRGGALRSVPVGGGCRRNKRSKSTTSKSNDRSQIMTSTSTTSNNNISSSGQANLLGQITSQLPPLRFMSPLGQINDNFGTDMGLSYSGISAPIVTTNEMNFNIGASNFLFSNVGGSNIEPWRLQQYPFVGGLDPFQGNESGFLVGDHSGNNSLMRPKFSGSMMTQGALVKMEENHEINLSRQLLGGLQENDHNWGNSAGGGGAGASNWTELSNFSSSSTANL